MSLAKKLAVASMLGVLALSTRGGAEEAAPSDSPEATLAHAEGFLAEKKPTEAIAELESLADRGYVDAAISFDRGLAYALRVRLGPETEGDLGRALHGFEEARGLSHDERTRGEAQLAITSLRSEVAKRRSRAGEPADVEEGLSLGRSVTRLLPETVWFGSAVAFSVLFTAALLIRRRARTRGESGQAGVALGLAALPLCLLATTFGLSARAERRELREGIVIDGAVRPFDDKHIVVSGAHTLPEGAKVRLFESDEGYVRFRRGAVEGFLPKRAVAELAR